VGGSDVKSDELFALLRRRGVLWPSAEIYGGAQGLYDYGPLGTALKRRVEDAWSAWFVGLSPDYYRIDPPEIHPEAVLRASGHLENFTDPEVTCGRCGSIFRAETVLEKVRPDGVDGLGPADIGALLESSGVACPNCGARVLGAPRPFNLMFGFEFGAVGGERAYLRPETAQGSFLAFPRMWEVSRRALPLGVAVIGRVYRNEIAPRQVLFRMRAFTQAELQIFFDPESFALPFERVADDALPVLRVDRRASGEERPQSVPARALVAEGGLPEFYVYHLALTLRFYTDVLRYPRDALRLYEKGERERAFYNRIQFDVEARLESLGGYKEMGAVHYRGDYDLGRHGRASGQDLSVPRSAGGRVLPHVLEITFGVDRNLWALADVHLAIDDERTVWRLPPYLAPVSVGVFPLLRKEHAVVARRVFHELLRAGLDAAYDEAGSIGRRYARMDEAGTPFCVTVDGGTVGDDPAQRDTVTVRERDSKTQTRVALSELVDRLRPSFRPPRAPDAAGA
jgi:glycyl-tRNA synthetase